MGRRFGDAARIVYHDVGRPEVREGCGDLVSLIREHGLIYPVTVINGKPVYDGAVSYPAIMRAVQRTIEEHSPEQ